MIFKSYILIWAFIFIEKDSDSLTLVVGFDEVDNDYFENKIIPRWHKYAKHHLVFKGEDYGHIISIDHDGICTRS